jgi:DNA-binding winged helix-turn-helix (wHTH) protein
MGQSARRWKFGWCEYVEISRSLTVHGVRSELRGKPLDLLQLLLSQPDKVLPSETLIQSVWGNASRQSLTVAISKLRKAFGGELDDLIQNVASEGYRMAVPVECTVTEEPTTPLLGLEPGGDIPCRSGWTAVRRLGGPDHSPVWLAWHESTGERQVFKFATDGVRLRALQREHTVAAILAHADAAPGTLWRVHDSNFSESPYFIAGEYVGPNLQELFATDEFVTSAWN